MEVRTLGAFGHHETRLEWVQPVDLWQGILYRYPGRFSLNGFSFDFVDSDLVVVPPRSRCRVDCEGADVYIYSYFTFCPMDSNRDLVALPVRSSLGAEGDFWDLNFRKGLNHLQLTKTPAHAVVFALLWSIAQPSHFSVRNVFVEEAEKFIGANIGNQLSIEKIAKAVHLSASHLNRLFMQEHGRTPMQFVRDQRAHLAHKLLTETTVPIKQIATECGLSDLHVFNRFVRERLGSSPREVRRARPEIDIFRTEYLKTPLDD
jgi:AraC-like DNA-binding protein